MVDVNTLIKIVRELKIIDWPDQVNYMRLHLEELLKGFPGIGLGHLSLVKFKDLLKTDTYIYDPSIMSKQVGTPMMITKDIIIGIGCGPFTGKKPTERVELDIPDNQLVLRVDCRPKETGGPGYFYFFKSKKDYQDVEDK